MDYIVLFFTQSGAMKFEKILTKKEMPCTLLPVPRKLSSSCGLSVKFRYEGDITGFINDDIDKIYEIADGKYHLIYEEEE